MVFSISTILASLILSVKYSLNLFYKYVSQHITSFMHPYTSLSHCDRLGDDILKSYWRRTQVVRERSAKPLFTGSNPVGACTMGIVSYQLALSG